MPARIPRRYLFLIAIGQDFELIQEQIAVVPTYD
jgi:hypothetical protein